MRILHMNISNDNDGGASTLINRIGDIFKDNSSDIHFDYLTMNQKKCTNSSGCRIYAADLRKNRFIGFLKLPFYVYQIVKKNKYEIVHIHAEMAWKILLYAIPSRLAGAKHIVMHAHSTGIDGDHRKLKMIGHKAGLTFLPMIEADYIACSKEAASFVFGNYIAKNKEVLILKNGIEVSKFMYSGEKRKEVRNKYSVGEKEILIGNTSNILYVKNPMFLARTFYELTRSLPNAKLIFVGKGDKKIMAEIKNYLRENEILDHVIFTGFVENVNEILSGLDVFVFPSLFEGLGISLVEAQANGLPCVVSDSVPSLSCILNTVKRVSLAKGPEYWSRIVKNSVGRRIYNAPDYIIESGFDISSSAEILGEFYKIILE